jgi:hypothetical protein
MVQLIEKEKKSVKNNKRKRQRAKTGDILMPRDTKGTKKNPKRAKKRDPKERDRRKGGAAPSQTAHALERTPGRKAGKKKSDRSGRTNNRREGTLD